MASEIPRGQMSPRERDLRSRLAKLAHSAGLLRATLNPRERVCGKPSCKCARGEKHGGLYLLSSADGKPRQLFVPRDAEERVRQWVLAYQEFKELLEEVSQIYWGKVTKRET